MTAESRITEIAKALSIFIGNAESIAQEEIEKSVEALNALAIDLHAIVPAIQQVSELNSAFSLVSQLLDAAHTDKLDADQMKCLLDPLREKLALATADIERVIN
jgi:hypothetical protein